MLFKRKTWKSREKEELELEKADPERALAPKLATVEGAITSLEGQALLDAHAERERLLIRMGRPSADVEQGRLAYLNALDRVIAKTKSHLFLWRYIEQKAELEERMGRPVDGARTHLLTAEVLRAFAGDKTARARLAAHTVSVAKYGLLGFELGEAFKSSYSKNMIFQAVQIEMKLVHEGRAVALGRCAKCGAVVEIDHVDAPPKGGGYERPTGRCPAGHKVKEFRIVVTEDREASGIETAS